ncbi:MAG: PAS domain S-box protein [Kangiellaceae bacterium]|nr:PAS domain S-box protein [Kangiellaceae bacterium]MCW9015772.1 PAS domain S-box protein [Kangiellaceae bacterium]
MDQQNDDFNSEKDTSTLQWRDYQLGEEFLDALAIIDNKRNIVQLSQRWHELLGRDPDQVIGVNFLEFVHPDDRETLISRLDQSEQLNATFDVEFRLNHKDGECRWIRMRSAPMNERNLVFLSVFNITPLKDTIGQLDSFFTLSPDLFCIVDFKGRFIRFNPAWRVLLGWSNEKLMQEPVLSFVHSDDIERSRVQFANNLEGADTTLFENRLRTINGTFRWVEWKSVTLVDEKIIFAIARDITSRKAYLSKQKDLEVEKATSQAKSLFLAAMSHELKTPLNGIIGSLDLAFEEANTPSLKELLNNLKVSSDSLSKIVNDILDYSAMDSGEIEFDPQPFSLKSLITSCELSFKTRANEKRLDLHSEFDLSLPDLVISDSKRITQVMDNLLDNAVRFTEQGSIIIKVEPSDPSINHYSKYTKPKRSDENRIWVKISVKDTGIGISMKQQLQIFDVFRQAAEFIKRKKCGLGIGLTISRHLVELLGGQLEVSSVLNKGSEFSFDIPFSISNVSEHLKDEPVDETVSIPPLRILVVEDNVINQKIVVRYLSNKGHTVIVAENGHLGIDAYESNIFDIILMDLQMPEMDGLTATRYIRELEAESGHRTPIVAMTAHAAKSDEEACYESGMDEFLVKPFRPHKLDAVLKKIIARR